MQTEQMRAKRKAKILVVGPSETRVRGGMATVISGMRTSDILNQAYEIDVHASCVNGNILLRLVYTAYAYIKFLFVFWRYDAVHIHVASYGSTFRKMMYAKAAKRAGKKVMLHLHSGKFLVFYQGVSAAKQKRILRFLKTADVVVALSEEWRAQYRDILGLQDCKVIPNGVDTVALAAGQCDVAVFANQFLFLGRLSEAKGIYDLIDALEIVKDKGVQVKCICGGEGDVEQVKALVAQKGIADYIDLAGWVNEADKIHYLKQCATLILPSHGEAFPMVVLEGMAAGKAIVATRVGAIPEAIGEHGGIIVAPKDPKALADAMITCAQNPAFLQSAADDNIARVDALFSQKKMHTEIRNCYEQML